MLSVSLFPSRGYIASGSFGGAILIREAEIVEVEVGLIETKYNKVFSLASGGENALCVWDSNTGELLADLIKDLDITVGINHIKWCGR